VSNLIKQLQSKPEEYRRMVALVASISITIVLFVVWISVMQKNIFLSDTTQVEKQTSKVASPIQSLKSGFIRLTSSVTEQVSATIDSLGEIEYKKDIIE